MGELKAASRKGLNATIQEIQGEKATSYEPEKPVDPVLTSRQISEELRDELESVQVKGDVISHLDNLEAEIWAALEETESLDISGDLATGEGVAMGGSTPVSSAKDTRTGEKIEVKKLANPPSSNKKVKVTSVQIDIRRSSRTEEPRKVQSQPQQPVKQALQDPKPGTAKRQPPTVVEVQDKYSVKLRHRREPVVSVKKVVKDTRAVKQEKTAPSLSSRTEPRRSLV